MLLLIIPLILLSIFVLSYLFIAQPNQIVGNSMSPTYSAKAYVITEKVSYRIGQPQRGDVIIFYHPQKDILIIERVIGLPNEKILLKEGKIYINNTPLTESYLKDEQTTFGKEFIKDNEEILIPPDSYVLMGDNRGAATDSRVWGFVPKENFVGRVAFCYFNCQSNQ